MKKRQKRKRVKALKKTPKQKDFWKSVEEAAKEVQSWKNYDNSWIYKNYSTN